MALSRPVIEIIRQLVRAIGLDLLVIGAKKIRSKFRSMFSNRNVLILGAKQTGKTSLIRYLTNGRPFEETNEGREPPNPTAGVAVVDRKGQVGQDEWVKIQKDVGGEPTFRDKWRELLEECNPEGIVFMVDGRLGDEGIRRSIRELRADVLDHYGDSSRRLISVHVFLNYCDYWYSSERAARSRCRQIAEILDEVTLDVATLEQVRFEVSITHLNPHRDSWPEAERAVKSFGASLAGR